MVNMNDEEANDQAKIARQEALKLGNDKSQLEEELKEWLYVLEKNRVGMEETLVDNEGFPRADLDVYQVRHARNRIICIRNDLKQIMEEIEKQLHIVHALSKDTSTTEPMEVESIPGPPIGRITSVTPNSPADEAGLKTNDQILNFGSVNSANFNTLSDVVNIVKHSINQIVKVIVLRDDTVVKLYLKPHPWSGQGMLGCVIIPIENVER